MKADEPFWQTPNRFRDALLRREINLRQFAIGCFLAAAVDYRTGEATYTLAALAEGLRWKLTKKTEQTLRNDLRGLRPTWIDYEVRQGQQGPYVFRLTGLTLGGQRSPNHATSKKEPLPDFEVTSKPETAERPASPQPPPDPPPSQLQSGATPKTRRDKTRNLVEESAERKTASTPTETTDRLLGALESLSEQQETVAAARRGTAAGETSDPGRADHQPANSKPPVRLRPDGSLEWQGEPEEGEAGALADIDALADAGIVYWWAEASEADERIAARARKALGER